MGTSTCLAQEVESLQTTRDEHLLIKLGVDKKYKFEELNCQESLQLFSRQGFKMTHPIEDYLQLSIGVVDSVGGLGPA